MVRGEIKIDVLSIGSLDAFSLTRDEGRKMEISKSNGGNILYYTETFSGGGGRVLISGMIFMKTGQDTDKKASIELVGIGMSVTFYVQGMYEPICTQGSGNSYWGSVKVEIHSHYFCGL